MKLPFMSNGKAAIKPTVNVEMSDEAFSTVYKTYDYSKFKLVDTNRIVNELSVRRLVESFKTLYLVTVLVVNERFEIIDGQHRFTAAKELGMPIYYLIVYGYGLKEIQTLNTNQKNWQRKDHLHSFCAEGNEAYLEFNEFMNQFPELGISASLKIFTGLHGGSLSKVIDGKQLSMRDFENGNLAVTKNGITKAYINARKIMQFKDYFSGFNSRGFVTAILPLLDLSIYDHKRMLHKLKTSTIRLTTEATAKKYRALLQEIYNWKAAKDDRSDFINV